MIIILQMLSEKSICLAYVKDIVAKSNLVSKTFVSLHARHDNFSIMYIYVYGE